MSDNEDNFKLFAVTYDKSLKLFIFSQIVIDFIPHVRGHFETVYYEKKQLAASASTASLKNVENATPVAETKQLEALQRQFDQVQVLKKSVWLIGLLFSAA